MLTFDKFENIIILLINDPIYIPNNEIFKLFGKKDKRKIKKTLAEKARKLCVKLILLYVK